LTCHFAKLDYEALLHLEGPDARTFLQGQVTCDIRNLVPGVALPGSYCTIKGRVVCDFLLCALRDEHLVLRLRRDIRADSAAQLAKYIVFSRAQLDAARDDWEIFACWGADAAAALQTLFGTLPTTRYGSCSGDGFTLVQLDAAGQQFECYLLTGAGMSWPRDLGRSMSPGELAAWQALQIDGGIARIEAATSGEFVPQMLNYDATGHISFNKGCYTGQEVVARLHYKGTAKRRLYRAELAADRPTAQLPGASDSLYRPGGEQAVGTVVNSAATADGRCKLLVSATTAGVDAGLHLFDSHGPLLVCQPAPYAVPAK
jgi:folate-binding protein YgfZ